MTSLFQETILYKPVLCRDSRGPQGPLSKREAPMDPLHVFGAHLAWRLFDVSRIDRCEIGLISFWFEGEWCYVVFFEVHRRSQRFERGRKFSCPSYSLIFMYIWTHHSSKNSKGWVVLSSIGWVLEVDFKTSIYFCALSGQLWFNLYDTHIVCKNYSNNASFGGSFSHSWIVLTKVWQ